ncbi:F-box/LRR-repeat protein [Trifolium pratense]|uniref:F-box/LRR-repeat protein n=1 Tax=Trifolium pratense TaxID=57577 RepID=A0A2K3LYA6_TRIPR|nr:F-box/LRR-repeat protein [Trifolium pratense]
MDDDRISELPDDILSYILTMLSIKDLLKTSVLSKRWCKLWFLMRDLHFDIHNVIGSEKELLEKGHLTDVTRYSRTDRCVDLDLTPKEFVKRVDQFLNNFHGTSIDSFFVNFYLDCQQSNTIDRWINFAMVRGVERINLLFLGRPYVHRTAQNKHYKFDSALFSETNASTLKHLHLEYCLVCHPTNVSKEGYRLDVDLVLVDCLKLISLEYHGYGFDTLKLNTPVLKNINFSVSLEELNAFVTLCATFPELEIMHLDIFLKVTTSLKITQPLKHLKQLNLMICNPFILDNEECDPLWILNILQASPLLQKLTIMVSEHV